ncbi:Ribosomal protein S18 acetylase RimI [Mucilaginibacter lappiensis]|uniref:Ribosomal protein S18 acetylase RimI-like enzyme n=1 Tax=Mucilaginibacter lappiensis TaxID=354630 RepID=A0ABR6PI15_9SPHI|nr:GNAT family N-acetyltransferase [Mucilaginibacter lappiensis]MBB6108630.1 ribosomal protein S18 acetylase RimI-like enzyme [Mucilaginibacter lappiensis]SIQ30224.1 Ribosomal protein S18 acetylase RimI [Mucilaginibacter lappiensis]
MENLKIDHVKLDDVVQLQNIGRQTFTETFSAVNTEENMAKYIEVSFSLGTLAAELSNKLSQFYFAVLDGEVIGYLKLNFGQAQTEIKDNNALEIERIYVSKEFQGKKVGQLLYNKAIQIAQQVGVNHVWLGVWEKNHKAISFYKKNGFMEFDRHIFKLGTDDQIDIMMKNVLKNE